MGYLAEELSKYNQILVLSTTANGKVELNYKSNSLQNIDGVNIKFFSRQTKDHSHLSLGLLKYLWNNGKNYDVIHIQSWWNLVALISALICKIMGWKYIVTPRGMLSPYTYQTSLLKKTIHLIFGDYLLKSSIIHTTSLDEEFKIKALNLNYKTCVVPNYINTDTPIIERTHNETTELLFLSRIHPKKGLDVLIRSLTLITEDVHLNIVGDGDKEYIESLRNLALELKVTDKITWHGSIYDDAKYKMYAFCDLMILPSQDENFANNVLESLLLGTPVIISKNVGLSQFVYENKLGFVYTGSEIELGNCIKGAIQNKEMLSNINNHSREIVLNQFDPKSLSSQYIALYKSI